jgi:hypothetical protein
LPPASLAALLATGDLLSHLAVWVLRRLGPTCDADDRVWVAKIPMRGIVPGVRNRPVRAPLAGDDA